MLQTLAEFFKEGGPFMFVNVATSAVAVAIIVERMVVLAFKLNINAPPFMAQVQKLVLANNVDGAAKLCAAVPGAALSRVVRSGLVCADLGEQEVARALEEAVLEVTPLVTKRIAPLWSLANVATLVGLIGTITCLLYTSPSPRDRQKSRMPSSA